MLKTKSNIKSINNKFDSEHEALKFVCNYLGTEYRKNVWCFENDLDCEGSDGWVLHIIVDGKNRFATKNMIDDWKNNKIELFDLLVNVFVEKDN